MNSPLWHRSLFFGAAFTVIQILINVFSDTPDITLAFGYGLGLLFLLFFGTAAWIIYTTKKQNDILFETAAWIGFLTPIIYWSPMIFLFFVALLFYIF